LSREEVVAQNSLPRKRAFALVVEGGGVGKGQPLSKTSANARFREVIPVNLD